MPISCGGNWKARAVFLAAAATVRLFCTLSKRRKVRYWKKFKKPAARLEGAFAFLILTEKNMYAIRDRHGLRPLSVARLGDGFCVSSESCAFDLVAADFCRDVQPGEILKFSAQGVSSSFYTNVTEHRLCAMEYIYFSRPDSNVDGLNVHTVRKETGRCLARRDAGTLQADRWWGAGSSVGGDRIQRTVRCYHTKWGWSKTAMWGAPLLNRPKIDAIWECG